MVRNAMLGATLDARQSSPGNPRVRLMIDDRFVPQWFEAAKGWQLALAGGLSVCILGTGNLGFWHWNLAAGAVFALLWLAPVRSWLWIALGTGAIGWLHVSWIDPPKMDASAARFLEGRSLSMVEEVWLSFIGTWAAWLLCLLPVYWLRRRVTSAAALLSTQGTVLLHVAALMAAMLMTLTSLLFVLTEGFVADTRRGVIVDAVAITWENAPLLLGTFVVKNTLGYFLGIMLMAPVLFWWSHVDLHARSRALLVDALCWLGPAVLAFIALTQVFPGTKLAEMLRLLLLAAVIVFAVRHGWRGAALSVLVVSVALAVEDHLGAAPQSPIWLQTFVAIAGAMALMFGVTVDQLRERGRELEWARAGEQRAREELAEAAGRVVRVQEEERRRLAADLHDEVGQNLTALQTYIKLAEPELITPSQRAFVDELRHVGGDMRRALREVLEGLHPAALSELGLVRALSHGVLRHRVEAAGLHFALHVRGEPGLYAALDDALRVSAYRIVQEAVNNALRHADAERIAVHLRVGWRDGDLLLALRVHDDGRGLPLDAPSGNGRRGMRDRALMLGGELTVRPHRAGGTQVKALLRQRGKLVATSVAPTLSRST